MTCLRSPRCWVAELQFKPRSSGAMLLTLTLTTSMLLCGPEAHTVYRALRAVPPLLSDLESNYQEHKKESYNIPPSKFMCVNFKEIPITEREDVPINVYCQYIPYKEYILIHINCLRVQWNSSSIPVVHSKTKYLVWTHAAEDEWH